jgi:hypothetical protein
VDAALERWAQDRVYDEELTSLATLAPEGKLEKLSRLREVLPDPLRPMAREIASVAIREVGHGLAASAFDDLSWLLPPEQRATLARALLATALPPTDGESAWALARTIAELPISERIGALPSGLARFSRALRERRDDRTMAVLATTLPKTDVVRLLAEYQRINDRREQVRLRFELAPYLEPERLSDLAAEEDTDQRLRMFARMMQQLVGVLGADQLQNFVRAACQLVGEWWVVEELSSVLLSTEDPHAIERVLEAAQEMTQADLRSRLAAKVVDRLAGLGSTDHALSLAWRVELSATRAQGLSDTAANLAKAERFDVARRVAATISDREERGRAQAMIALFAARVGRSAEAHDDVAQIASERWRGWAAERLASAGREEGVVPRPRPSEASRVVNEYVIEPIAERAGKDERWAELRGVVTTATAAELDAELDAFFRRVAADEETFLDRLARQDRPRLLEDFCRLVHVLGRAGAIADLGRLEEAVRDVGRWWP